MVTIARHPQYRLLLYKHPTLQPQSWLLQLQLPLSASFKTSTAMACARNSCMLCHEWFRV